MPDPIENTQEQRRRLVAQRFGTPAAEKLPSQAQLPERNWQRTKQPVEHSPEVKARLLELRGFTQSANQVPKLTEAKVLQNDKLKQDFRQTQQKEVLQERQRLSTPALNTRSNPPQAQMPSRAVSLRSPQQQEVLAARDSLPSRQIPQAKTQAPVQSSIPRAPVAAPVNKPVQQQANSIAQRAAPLTQSLQRAQTQKAAQQQSQVQQIRR